MSKETAEAIKGALGLFDSLKTAVALNAESITTLGRTVQSQARGRLEYEERLERDIDSKLKPLSYAWLLSVAIGLVGWFL